VKVDGRPYRSIWRADDGRAALIVDQTLLPHEFRVVRLETLEEAARAIADMQVRGAPLIGVTAAYGMALALLRDPSDAGVARAVSVLRATRPTAVNLQWALRQAEEAVSGVAPEARAETAFRLADRMAEEDVERNRALGAHGLEVLREAAEARRGEPVRVLTHCNAGWLATVDWGTATSPVYQAWDAGIPLHVWVDETRPRLQGARLTAWEMAGHGVPHRVVPDGAAAWLMRTGQVDLVIVGTDRTTASGDVANKIGTYPLALAASDNGVPFFVAAPSPSIDWELSDGADIPIEERAAEEVTEVQGADADGSVRAVRIANPGSDAANFAFDVTPARLVTGIVTERGVCPASREGLAALFRAPDAGAASSGSAGSSPAEGSGPRETGEGTGPGDATEPPVRG
jgi:methylthioribose-1-phosphate isomerase